FAGLDLDLASPGDSTRIIPVKDAIEPRVKLSGGQGYFPGYCAPMNRAGQGSTFVLDGACVVTCGPIVGFQEGFIDMSGPVAAYTPFSETHNVVLTAKPTEGLDPHAYEAALREAGLKLAVYLAECCKGHEPDEIQVFDKGSVSEEAKKYPDLPKILYVMMSITQGLLHDTYVYAADLRPSLPTLLHPNETLDGALVSGNCVSACDKNTTYHHLNNPVVRALYARHGKDLNFLGMVPAVESTVLEGKLRAAQMNAALAAELGADAVIVSEEGYGNPDTDLCLNAKNMESQGIVTVLVSDEAAGTDGASQGLADAAPELVSFISTGNVNEMVEAPAMKKVIGEAAAIALLSGGAAESLRPDGSMLVELQSIIGSTCELGFSRIGCDWI
ncbi:MAG: glycine/sarcosine/betaine reductase component B subunit, partial [Candidatus Adiutrix sp.]|nr:glycine/sarcosine/betaine reductase component B subunit [Candidatus Adiutrix sp.]